MKALRNRFLDLVLSLYLYNEYQGYTQLQFLMSLIEEHLPEEKSFLAALRKHAADEEKHCLLFTRYFRSENRMPFKVQKSVGYFDLLVRTFLGRWTWELGEKEIFQRPGGFSQLCRIVMMTEFRGMKQVEQLLSWKMIRNHAQLHRIFKVIEKDEPSHYLPYRDWLMKSNERMPSFPERFLDIVVHYTIALVVFPLLFLSPGLSRMQAFPSEG